MFCKNLVKASKKNFYGFCNKKGENMINYLQLTRNLRKYAPRVEPKSATYIFNPKGIYDFKQMNKEIAEALSDTFNGIEYPVLELSLKRGKGTVRIKDGYKEVSTDNFVLLEGVNVEDYLPETDGCVKKLIYDKDGIKEIGKHYGLLAELLKKFTFGLKKPQLEMWVKYRTKYMIGNIVLKDEDRVVSKGYFSKENNGQEKFHFTNDNELITGYNLGKDERSKKYQRLPMELLKRLWILDERAKYIMKKQYGIGCSPKYSKQIALKMKVTGSRIREIVGESKTLMKLANTYIPELKADLDDLGHILTDEERYRIFKYHSSIDINSAETKIIKYKNKNWLNQKNLSRNI